MNSYELDYIKSKNPNIDIDRVKEMIKSFKIETPSWGYSNSGTRFKVFEQKGMPRNIFEKLEDAAQVHKYTGICPTVAVHIPWDYSNNFNNVVDYAKTLGVEIGAINPNLFQEDFYKFGSICNIDEKARQSAVDHVKECIDIGKKTKSRDISLWLADGTNYPGQGDFRERKANLEKSLSEIYEYLPEDMRLLIEYKTFEPAFYHTDIADWGMSNTFCQKLGARAKVLVDLGHHSQGVNIEHIVAFLLDEGNIGGFHFNNRKYADDDLIVGTINPYELFLIFHEIVKANDDSNTADCAKNIAYMIDQSHNIEPKIPAMIRSVLNIQQAYAKALIVDNVALCDAQKSGDILRAENVLKLAFETDVSPILNLVRKEMGLETDPMKAYLESGYEEYKLKRDGSEENL